MNNQTEFIFKKTGEKVEVERWAWAAIYKPTEEAIKKAKQLQEMRNKELLAGKQQAVKEAVKSGQSSDEVVAIGNNFDVAMATPIPAEKQILKQFDEETGEFHQIGEIEQDRLEMFTMYKPSDPDLLKRIDMPFNSDEMKLVHKYKMVKPFYLDQYVRVYMFGYNKGKQTHRVFILPDDRMIVSDTEVANLPNYQLTIPKE